jgi:hypothetical protein
VASPARSPNEEDRLSIRGATPKCGFQNKRKLETALQELRELREALPAADKVRIERRKSGSVGLQVERKGEKGERLGDRPEARATPLP